MSHKVQYIEPIFGKCLQFSTDTEIANLIESLVPAKCHFKYHKTLLLTYLEHPCFIFYRFIIHSKINYNMNMIHFLRILLKQYLGGNGVSRQVSCYYFISPSVFLIQENATLINPQRL